MARRREPPRDAYEYAARRVEDERISQQMGDPLPRLPPELETVVPGPRMRRRLLLLAGVLAILVVGGIATHRPPAPDCGTPKLTLSKEAIARGEGLRWTATGPRDKPVTVVLAGATVSRPDTTLADCRAVGFFQVQAPPGDHAVVLLDAGGNRLVTRPLVVTD